MDFGIQSVYNENARFALSIYDLVETARSYFTQDVPLWTEYPARSKPVIQYSAKSEHSIRPILLPEPLIQIMKPLRKEKASCLAAMRRGVMPP